MDVIQEGAFSSPLYASKRRRLIGPPSSEPTDFTVRLWDKDQRLVLEEAARQGYAMPQLEAVRGFMQDAISRGLGEEDTTALVRLFLPR
jgi:3-hydroxyisobutyrate dehydrogenase-like beta-hydroxyacid dehydrogenase